MRQSPDLPVPHALVMFGVGAPLAAVSYLVGGFDSLFRSLLVVIVLDLVSGVTAAVGEGDLASHEFIKGIAKKFGYVLAVALAVQIETVIPSVTVGGVEVSIRTALISAFLGGEMLSVCENLARCGVPLPTWLLERLRGFGGAQ